MEHADELLPAWIGLAKSKGTSHSATFTGPEGTVTLSAQQVQDARAGATVATLSTTTQTASLPAHAHTVTFNPASSTSPSPGY